MQNSQAEVTITDEEAQDIIDLADKLKDAVGGEEEMEAGEEEMEAGEEEMEASAEEEPGLEAPGDRVYEEELYEAALKGLNIDFVDDRTHKKPRHD